VPDDEDPDTHLMTSTGSSVDVPAISREALAGALRARRVTLVDVLSPESFAVAHLPGAINLPVAEIGRRAAEVLPDKLAAIVTYCGSST
jgi:rhodanese-related sulfurtransferase